MTSKVVSESIENTKAAYSFENKSIEGIIADLRVVIDQIGINQANARILILELARRYDENKVHKERHISIKIKEVLQDKIKEGKITERWIEKCLPAKYKGKYTKSEVSSLSKKAKKLQEMVVDNNGNVRAELVSTNRSEIENTPSRKSPLEKGQLVTLGISDDEGGCPRCSELEETLLKTSPLLTAECLSKSEIMITIPKDRYEEIKSVMQKSSDIFYIIVNSASRSFVRAELDMNDLI